MKTEKLFIKNRKGQKVSVLAEVQENQSGLVFAMHGLSGVKEDLHIQAFAEPFREQGCTVVRFDTTNSFGQSDGNYADATVTNYYEDLEDVIAWASKQSWYQEPFYLTGHSLGGISIALFAEKHPDKVKGLAPVSTVVSGKLMQETYQTHRPDEFAEWNKSGWKIEPSLSRPGLIKKLRWKHYIEDMLKYDLIKNVRKLTMPVLLIVGEKDIDTPPEHQKLLFGKLPGRKELHIIRGAEHRFGVQHLDEFKNILRKWLRSF